MFRLSLALIAVVTLPYASLGASKDQSAELLKRDRQWSAVSSKGKNADEIVSYWTDDALLIVPGMPILSGHNAIHKFIKDSLAVPGFHITWTPQKAVVSKDGTVGYTTGIGEITAPGANGKLSTSKMRYCTTWTRRPGHPWRCSVDISNSEN